MAEGISDAYEIQGKVEKIYPFQKGQPLTFKVKIQVQDENGIRHVEYRCRMGMDGNRPIFCPLHEGDMVSGLVQADYNSELIFNSAPFVQVPVTEEAVKTCFIRALPKTGFGKVSADKLYKVLKEEVRRSEYVSSRITENKLSDKKSPSKAPPCRSKKDKENDEFKKLINGDDGVIPILSTQAATYSKNKDERIVTNLAGKTGLKPEQIQKLLFWWHKHRSLRRLHLMGLYNSEIDACHMSLDEIYAICMKNPLTLPSIPLEKAKKIMQQQGMEPDEMQIKCGQIVRKIQELEREKQWACTPSWLLGKQFPNLHVYTKTLTTDYKVTYEHSSAYLNYAYKVEVYVANFIDRMIKKTAARRAKNLETMKNEQKSTEPGSDDGKLEAKVIPASDYINYESATFKCQTLTDEQKIAVQGALDFPISFITGGAGTGKSTVIGELIHNLNIRKIPYIIVSFTGKAVSRLNEILEEKVATTMDRAIKQATQLPKFSYVIIDEVSMVTTELFYRWLITFQKEWNLVMVGDANQLQPIGWGTLMNQLLASERIPNFRLTLNKRLAKTEEKKSQKKGLESPDVVDDRVLLVNANGLIDPHRDRTVPMEFEDGTGFSVYEGDIGTIQSAIEGLHDRGVKDSKIKILCPVNARLPELNSIFQSVYLEEAIKEIKNGTTWCVGDLVMMLKNNYDINVMNGEEGRVIDITPEGVQVEFGDGAAHLFMYAEKKKPFEYKKKRGDAIDDENDEPEELTTDLLVHSWAITINKSQGSEYDYVFVVFFPDNRENKFNSRTGFLNINLLYTAMTRTKKCCWIVGPKDVISKITCTEPSRRYENLALRLKEMKDAKAEEVLAPFVVDLALKKLEEARKAAAATADNDDNHDDPVDDDPDSFPDYDDEPSHDDPTF